MKKFLVFASTPAVAEINVSGENESDAINKVKAMIDAGEEVGFDADYWDSGDVEFSALELEAEKAIPENATEQELKSYTIILEATSHKEVAIMAISPEAAEALAKEMYFNSDVLDFTDADVIRVRPIVVTDEEEEDDKGDELMTGFVKLIRSTDAPDDILGHILNRAVHEVFGGGNGENEDED